MKLIATLILSLIIINSYSQAKLERTKSNPATSTSSSIRIKLSELTLACSYYGETLPNEIYTFDSDNEAQTALARILNVSGLPTNFKLVAGNVPNACATLKFNYTTKSYERYIIYNQTFIQRINSTSNWASISILAHEVGHHLAGHSLQSGGSRPEIELEADKFSGFVLKKLGATLEQAQSAIKLIASEVGSFTHPSRSARLAAIANGWINSENLKSNSNSVASTQVRPRDIGTGFGNIRAEKLFIKRTNLNEFKLVAENGYQFRSSEFKQIDLGPNNKLFWFADFNAYFSITGFDELEFNTLVECKCVNKRFVGDGISFDGNFVMVMFPENEMEIYYRGEAKSMKIAGKTTVPVMTGGYESRFLFLDDTKSLGVSINESAFKTTIYEPVFLLESK